MGQAQLLRGLTAQRLQALAELFEQGQGSELAARTLDKLVAYEVDSARTQLRQIQADLAEFERQYGLASAEFYRLYQAGQTDDRMDYVEWVSLVQMAENLERRIQLLAPEPGG